MLGSVANVHHPAAGEMAIADVKITMITINRDATSPKLTAIEGKIIVVELQEGHASFAIFEQAVFKGGFRERLALVGMAFQDRGIGEAPKRQMPVRDFRLKALGGLIVESHPGFASAIQFKADKSRIGHAIQAQHRPATAAIPNQLCVATTPNDQPTNPSGSRRAFEHERSGNSVDARGKVEN